MISTASAPEPQDASQASADVARPADNLERLLAHLKDGSLAAAFATAYRGAPAGKQGDALRAIVEQRLRDAKEKLHGAKA